VSLLVWPHVRDGGLHVVGRFELVI
jgi:hypothetical protein